VLTTTGGTEGCAGWWCGGCVGDGGGEEYGNI